jgi:hypothetical protein
MSAAVVGAEVIWLSLLNATVPRAGADGDDGD